MRAEKEPLVNTILLQNNCPDNIITANPGEMLYRDGRNFYKVVNETELIRIEVAFKSFAYPDYANRWYASTNENWKYKFKHPYEIWIKESGVGTKLGWQFVGFKKLFIDYVKMTVTPTPTPTPTPSLSASETPTPTPSLSVSNTPTPTPTPSSAPTVYPNVGISAFSYSSYSTISDIDSDLFLIGNPTKEQDHKSEVVTGDGVTLLMPVKNVSDGASIYRSTDNGSSWTNCALPVGLNSSTVLYHIVYTGNGKFIAAGNYDTIVTSSDYGLTWGISKHSYDNWSGGTAPSEPYYPRIRNGEYSSLYHVNNRTIAIKARSKYTQDSSSIKYVMGEYSNDGGATWIDIDITSQSFGNISSIGFSPRFKSIVYGDGKLVAVGSTYENTTGSWHRRLSSIYSTDFGETWSDITYITGTNFDEESVYSSNNYRASNRIAHGNGTFVCIPYAYSTSSLIVSQNGVNWSVISSSLFNSSDFSSVAFSGGIFFALKQYAYGKDGQGIVYYTSIDGINWIEHFYSGIASTGYFTTIVDLNDQTIDYPSPIKTSHREYSTVTPTNYTASLAIELTGSSGEITLNQTCQYNLLYNNNIWYKFTDTASLYRQFTAKAFSASIDCLPISMTVYKNIQTGSLELSTEFNRNDSKEITIGFDSEPNIEYYIMLDVGQQGSRDSSLNFKYNSYPTQSITNNTFETAIELTGNDLIVTSSILSNKPRWYSWTPSGNRTFVSVSFSDNWSNNSYNYNKNSNISFYYLSGSELQSGSLKSLYIRNGDCEKTGGYYTDRFNYIIPTESKYYFKISADYEIYKPTQYSENYFGGGGWDGKFEFRIKDVTGDLQPTTSFALDFIQNFPRLPINIDSNAWGTLTASLTSSILTRAVDSRAPYFPPPASTLFGYADYYYIPKESITKQGSIVLQISSSTKNFYPIVHAGSNAESVLSGEPYWYNYIQDEEHIIPFVGHRLYVGKDNQPYSFTVTSSVDYFIRIIGMLSDYSGSNVNSTKMYGDYSLQYKFIEEDTSIPTFIHISGSYIDYNVTYTSKSFSPRNISSVYSAWRSCGIAVRPSVDCKLIASIEESSTYGKEDRSGTWERLSYEPSAKIPTIQSNVTASFYNPRLFFSTASWYICNPTIQKNCSAGELCWFDIQQAYSDKLNIRIRTLASSSYNISSPYEFSGSAGNIIFDENKYSRTCYIKYVSTDNGLLEVIPNEKLSFSETNVQYFTTISGSVVTGYIYPLRSPTPNSVLFPIKSGSSYLLSIRNDYTTNELLNYSGTGFSYNILPEYYSPNFDEQHATVITGSEITFSGYNNMKVFDDPSTARLNWWRWIPTETGIATIDNNSFMVSSSRLSGWSWNRTFIAYQGEEYLMSLNPLGYPTASISLKTNPKQLGNKNTSIQNAFLFTSSYVNINQNTICNTDTWEMYKYYWKYNIFTSQSITASISSVGNLEISKQPSSSGEFVSLATTESLAGDYITLYATASAGDVVYITYTPTSARLYTINGTIIIPVPPPPPPSNDSFYNAIELIGLSGQLTASNSSATLDSEDPSGPNTKRSIWYTWAPNITGPATISTIGSNFDTYLYLYKLNDGAIVSQSNLTFIASDDDSGGSGTSKIITNLTSGSRYYIAVGGYNSSYVGNIVFNYSI